MCIVHYRQAHLFIYLSTHLFSALFCLSFFFLSFSLPLPTHEALFVVFLIQHSTSEIIFFTEISFCKSPSLSTLQIDRKPLCVTLFQAKTTSKRCFYLIYRQSMSTRRDLQERFGVFGGFDFFMLSSSHFFVLLTAAI